MVPNRSLSWLSSLTKFTVFMTVILLGAGALVTSTGSGLAVPDWPLSYGQFFPPMIGGILYEHGHRLIAGSVALLAVIQAVLIWKFEPRPSVKRLALVSVVVVLSQATLGGLTVLLRLPHWTSVSHACLAQIFFSTITVIAVMMSASWKKFVASEEVQKDSLLQISTRFLPFAFFMQLIFGATMRHTGAGLAIPDFPLSFGHWIPSVFTPAILIHYCHRVGAFTMVVLVTLVVARIYQKHTLKLGLVAVGGLLSAFVALQIMMGAMIIWLRKPVPLTSAHLVVGACCLATSVVLAVLVGRHAWELENITKPQESSLKPGWVTA
jgi:cytochrome c oxidase assembly protein subunit 15